MTKAADRKSTGSSLATVAATEEAEELWPLKPPSLTLRSPRWLLCGGGRVAPKVVAVANGYSATEELHLV